MKKPLQKFIVLMMAAIILMHSSGVKCEVEIINTTDSNTETAIVTSPCLSYYNSDPKHCQECQDGYTLLIFNQTSTICAVAEGPLTDDTNRTYNICTINSTEYPYEANLQQSQSVVFEQEIRYGNQKSYCFSCNYYFSRNGQQLCTQCKLEDDRVFSDTSLQSIYIRSQGCLDCSVQNMDQEVVTYQGQVDLYIRECKSNSAQNFLSCSYTEFYDTKTKSCQSCASKYPNCAGCTATTCTICQAHYYWNPQAFDSKTGSRRGMCLFNSCPAGYCRDTTRKVCETSLVSNCQLCLKQFPSTEQVCTLCSSGYLPSVYVNGTSYCKQLTGFQTLNYFIKSGAPMLKVNYTYYPTSTDGKSPAKPFYFIQEALTAIHLLQQTNFIGQMEVNVYIGKGNHFFFQCDGDEQTTTLGNSRYAAFVNYCNLAMEKVVILNDNIVIHFLPLLCNKATSMGYQNNADFKNMCLYLSFDTKPIIFVNHPNSQFNISGAATFDNLKFTGINAFAQSNVLNHDLSVFPIQLCDLQSEPSPGDTSLKLIKVPSNTITNTFNYTCKDIWYTNSTIPYSLDDNPRCDSNDNRQFSTSQQSTLRCSGDPNSEDFFWQNSETLVYSKRRSTLFNLYPFGQHTTTYSAPPSLNITNCDFEYFLGGYNSLINVENNNIMRIVKQNAVQQQNVTYLQDQHFFTYNGGPSKMRIYIENSSFKHSRFCQGMITYRNQIYIDQYSSFGNFSQVLMKSNIINDDNSYIIIYQSIFHNLNFLTNVTALAVYGGDTPLRVLKDEDAEEDIYYQSFIHQGIVLNVEDFRGPIEIVESTFTHNMHFIPEIMITPQDGSLVKNIDHFKDAYYTQEYKMSICNEDIFKDQYFFQEGISMTDDIDDYFDRFERLGLIYVSRNKREMILRQNTFKSNMGTFGGAVTVNSPDWKQGSSPYLILQENTFSNNFAYFTGNAIYIRNTKLIQNQMEICGGVYIEKNNFTHNIGMKIHNGGAIGAVCTYLEQLDHDDYKHTSTYTSSAIEKEKLNNLTTTIRSTLNYNIKFTIMTSQFTVNNSRFIENYSGQRGTAIYYRQMSKIRIQSCLFQNNGPVLGYFETQLSPYTLYFSKKPATFADPEFGCFEEFQYINSCQRERYKIDWPRVRGAVHVLNCNEEYCLNTQNHQQMLIYHSEFINNDAGPYFDEDLPVDLASSIYIFGGYINNITNTTFRNHSGNNNYFIDALAPKLTKYFPDIYFKYAQAPIIRIIIQPHAINSTQILNFSTTLISSSFLWNKHIQVLGLNFVKQYYGSLISIDTYYEKGNKYAPMLNLENCTVKDNQFKGNETSLIYAFKGLVSVVNSNFYGNGYLTKNSISQEKVITTDSSKYFFPFEEYTYKLYQGYGIFYLIGMEAFPKGYLHKFINNTFQYCFSYEGSVYAMKIDDQYVLYQNNSYSYNFANKQGPVMFGRNQDGRSTFKFVNELVNYSFSSKQGALSFEPHDPDFSSVLVYNSTFKNCFATDGAAIYFDSLAIGVVQNCTFYQDSFHPNRTAYITQQFKKNSIDITEFIDYKYFYQLADQSKMFTGQIYMEESDNTGTVYFMDEVIKNHTIDPYYKFSEVIDCTFYNTSSNQGSAINVGNDMYLRIRSLKKQTSFINNTQVQYGVIYISLSVNIILQDLLFKHNNAIVRGSAIGFTNAKVEIYNCQFLNNHANDKGTFFLFGDFDFICDQCLFQNNYAADSSGIFSINNYNGKIEVRNSQFINNTHQSNLNNIIMSKAIFTNTTFYNNIAQKVNNGITMIDSEVTLSNVTVDYTDPVFLWQNNFNVDSGFFNLNYQSKLFITNRTVIKNCRGAIATVLYATGSSSVYIDGNTQISNCYTESDAGSTMYFTMTDQININNTLFTNNSQIDLSFSKASANISNTKFQLGAKQFIYAQETNLTVKNSTFQNGENKNVNGRGVYCYCDKFILDSCLFQNLKGLQGGAVYVSSSARGSQFQIKNNSFLNNQAMQGGAFRIQDAVNISFIGNKFSQNSAYLYLPQTSQSQKLVQKGFGGAISIECFNEKVGLDNNCIYNFQNKNQFLYNYASNDGGAIIFTGNQLSDDKTTIFIGNSASYGSDMGSYAKELIFQFVTNNDWKNNYTDDKLLFEDQIKKVQQAGSVFANDNDGNRMRRILMSDSNVNRQKNIEEMVKGRKNIHRIELGLDSQNPKKRGLQTNQTHPQIINLDGIVSGTPIKFLIYIIDQNGNLYTTDSKSIANVKSSTKGVILQNFEETAQYGVYNFSNFIINTIPGTTANFSLTIDGLETYANNIEFLMVHPQIVVQSRLCVQGEQYTIDLRCIICPNDTYLYQAPTDQTDCVKCSDSANCYGLYHVAPKKGYWRSSNISTNFIKCPNFDACEGGSFENPTGSCTTGYTGVVCGNCQTGYKKTGEFQCKQCPNRAVNSIQFVGLILVSILICSFLVRSTITSSNKAKPLYSVYMKIMANHFQVVGAISAINYNWPNEIQALQSGQSSISGLTDDVFSFDCFLEDAGIVDMNDRVYLQKVVFYALLPLMLCLLSILFWSIVGFFNKRKSIRVKDNLISTMVVLLFLIHPNIAKVLFSSFNCMEIDGTQRLKDNIEMKCYEGKHLLYLLTIIVPAVITWVFGIPLAALILLLKNRQVILQLNRFHELSKADQFSIAQIKLKYGFLFNGYKIKTFFWEVITLYRKILIVMVTVFFSIVSTETQIMMVMMILLLSIILHIRFQPFYTKILNRMELYSLQVQSITLYGGLFYVTGSHYNYMDSNGIKWFFLFFILTPNLVFFAYWLHWMRVEALKMLILKNVRIFRFVTCNSWKVEDFEKKYMKKDDVNPYEIKKHKRHQSDHRTDGQDGDDRSSQRKASHLIDDFSDIIMNKQINDDYKENQRSSMSDSEYALTKHYEGKVLDVSKSKDNYDLYEDSPKKIKGPINTKDIKLDFPAHMLKRISSTEENNIESPSKRTLPTAHTNRYPPPLSSRKVVPQALVDQQLTARKNQRYVNELILESSHHSIESTLAQKQQINNNANINTNNFTESQNSSQRGGGILGNIQSTKNSLSRLIHNNIFSSREKKRRVSNIELTVDDISRMEKTDTSQDVMMITDDRNQNSAQKMLFQHQDSRNSLNDDFGQLANLRVQQKRNDQIHADDQELDVNSIKLNMNSSVQGGMDQPKPKKRGFMYYLTRGSYGGGSPKIINTKLNLDRLQSQEALQQNDESLESKSQFHQQYVISQQQQQQQHFEVTVHNIQKQQQKEREKKNNMNQNDGITPRTNRSKSNGQDKQYRESGTSKKRQRPNSRIRQKQRQNQLSSVSSPFN